MQAEINQIKQLIQQIEAAKSLGEFETIELPFQLVTVGINLWETTLPAAILQHLASSDPETLDAWAIALAQTLQTQLNLLQQWLHQISTLPIPPTLQQQIEQRIQQLSQIATEKSQLLKTATALLSQEQQLKRDAAELQNLNQKTAELQQIQAELQATNLENLRQAIALQTAAIAPEKQTLDNLKQQKAALDAQIAACQQQQTQLQAEIDSLKNRQQSRDRSLTQTARELITLTAEQQASLSTTLATVLADLAQQQLEFKQTQQQLNQAIADFNRYQTATVEMRDRLDNHYQADAKLGQILPANHQKISTLISNIQQNLAQLDQELAAAQTANERSRQKTIFTF